MITRIAPARPHVAYCLALFASLLLGCSGSDLGPTGTVSGTVRLKGEPLSAGHGVVFMDTTAGHNAFGLTDAAGKFRIDSWNEGNLPVGKYAVTIRPAAPAVDPETIDPAVLMDHPELAADSKVKYDFPKKYLDIASSGLSYEVKEGENDFTIDLEE